LHPGRDAVLATHLSGCSLVRSAAANTSEIPGASRIAAAWEALRRIEDPEIPAISIVDLGLIRYVKVTASGRLEVGLSPPYVGCPATEVIRRSVNEALAGLEIGDCTVANVLSPPWSSDWITAE